MSLSTPTLQSLFPDLICLDGSIDRLTMSQPMRYSNNSAERNAEINQICLDAVLRWILTLHLTETPIVSSSHMLWEFVNGSVITLGTLRLILIPHAEEHTEEFTIPQEWIDCPTWMGDYYLPIHLDPMTQQVCLLGYVPHNTVKQQGIFDPIYRTYEVDRSAVIPDLELLWIARHLALQERAIPTPIPVRQPSTIILQQLSQSSRYSPRLEASFEDWMAIMMDEGLREQLYQARLVNAMRSAESMVSTISTATQPSASQLITNLTQWLHHNFETSFQQGWQTIDSLLNPPSLHYSGIRQSSLTNIMSLAKLMNLQVQLETRSVILLIALTPNPDQTVSLLVQVHPDSQMQHLPERLSLSLQDGDTILQSVMSRTQDQVIQLRSFTCTPDTQFRIGLELEGVVVTEDFTIDDSRIEA